MKFTSIPDNGSPWSDELIYSIDSEVDTPTNLVVDIRDIDNNISLGRCRLYNVTTASVNIAPYLRSTKNLEIRESGSLMAYISPAARNIGVLANGYASEQRTFFRTTLDCNKERVLSLIATPQVISLGEQIRLTVFAKENIRVTVDAYSSRMHLGSQELSQHTYGNPIEIVVPTAEMSSDTERIVVTIYSDNGGLQRTTYCVVKRDLSAHRLMWYNRLGGVECYTFPRSMRTSYIAKCSKAIGTSGYPLDVCQTEQHYRLTSAIEVEEEMNRIAEIIFSPVVFELNGESVEPVELTTRELRFDSHGAMRQLSIDIRKSGRGGELC